MSSTTMYAIVLFRAVGASACVRGVLAHHVDLNRHAFPRQCAGSSGSGRQ